MPPAEAPRPLTHRSGEGETLASVNVQAAARVVAAAVAAQVHGALARRASGGGAVERRSAPARASRVPRAGHAPPRRGASLISAPLRLRKEPATHYVLHCESPSVPEPPPPLSSPVQMGWSGLLPRLARRCRWVSGTAASTSAAATAAGCVLRRKWVSSWLKETLPS